MFTKLEVSDLDSPDLDSPKRNVALPYPRPRVTSIITGTATSSPVQMQKGLAAQGSQYAPDFLNVIAVTGNMGNHSLDDPACKELTDLMKDNQADLMVINVQEAKFLKIQQQLDKELNGANCPPEEREFVVGFVKMDDLEQEKELPYAMSTKTKALAFNTGITSLFIYRNHHHLSITSAVVDVEHPHVKIQRRHGSAENIPSKGSANNKCGSLFRLVVNKLGQEFRVDVMSAHLDSDTVSQRLKDWLVMWTLVHPGLVGDYQTLESLASDTFIIGMDANVRDHAILNGVEMTRRNLFTTRSMEVAPFLNAGFGPLYGTQKTSYHDDDEADKLDNKAKNGSLKRRGVFGEPLFASGPLDLIGLSLPRMNAIPPVVSLIENDDATHQSMVGRRLTLPAAGKAKRDHALVISPLLNYKVAEVEVDRSRVKQFLINMLFSSAPKVAEALMALSVKDPRFEALVLGIYNGYLADAYSEEQCGLIPRFFKQHIRLIEQIEQLTLKGLKDPKQALSSSEIEKYRQFFDAQGPWCALDSLWQNTADKHLHPLSNDYYNLLNVKYDYQELFYQAFAEARNVNERKQILYLSEKFLKQPGIDPNKLNSHFKFLLACNRQIFDMEIQIVAGKDFQRLFEQFLGLWLKSLDAVHDNIVPLLV